MAHIGATLGMYFSPSSRRNNEEVLDKEEKKFVNS
jgi:hypothetical protein